MSLALKEQITPYPKSPTTPRTISRIASDAITIRAILVTTSFCLICLGYTHHRRAPVGQTRIHLIQCGQGQRSLGVPTLITLSVRGTRVISPQGQASRHLPHLMQRERNSSSGRAPGGRMKLSFRPKKRMNPARPMTIAPSTTKPRNARRVRSESSLSRPPILTAILLHLVACLLFKMGGISALA